MTRGALWEITSVPDIRVQARDCARRLVERLERPDAGAPATSQASASA